MKKRNIEAIIAPPNAHYVGDGFRVHNFIPGANDTGMQRMDPFIMLDYNSKFYFSPTDSPRGVSVHPHRGFETVTIAYKGSVAHHDSTGNSGVIKEGDVQWMTAASGILHKEFHEKEFSKAGGDFQMIQLWVNLPAKDKMSKPKYQAISHEEIPQFHLPGNEGTIEVIAGNYESIKGKATTFTPVHLLNARVKKGAKVPFTFPENYHTALLVIEGNIKINDADIAPADHFALFKNDGETFSIEASEDSIILVLSGEPINEPVAARGPFVMNTREEISQAIEDYNMGKFGFLED